MYMYVYKIVVLCLLYDSFAFCVYYLISFVTLFTVIISAYIIHDCFCSLFSRSVSSQSTFLKLKNSFDGWCDALVTTSLFVFHFVSRLVIQLFYTSQVLVQAVLSASAIFARIVLLYQFECN